MANLLDEEAKFVSSGREIGGRHWKFLFSNVETAVDKIVEWENMATKSLDVVFSFVNFASFYIDLIETLVAKNDTSNIVSPKSNDARVVLQGTLVKMCRTSKEVLNRRLKTSPNKKFIFRNMPKSDEAKIVIHVNRGQFHKRMIYCTDGLFSIKYSKFSLTTTTIFYLDYTGQDPFWPPEIVYFENSPALEVGDCCVCLETCENLTGLVCRHKMCTSCIDAWKRIKQTCPLCRATLKMLVSQEKFDNLVFSRPPAQLWFIMQNYAETVGVSPWRWKRFENSRKKPRLWIDVDCVLTTDADAAYKDFQYYLPIRIKRLKILCFR